MIDHAEMAMLEARARAAQPVLQPPPEPAASPTRADHIRERLRVVGPALRNGAFIAARIRQIRMRMPPGARLSAVPPTHR